MKLLTKELLKQFEKVGRDEDTPVEEKVVIAKFFNPYGAGTWYATEYDPEEELFFGYCIITDGEWGYFALGELEAYKFHGVPFMGIERDLYWKPCKFKEVVL